MIWISIIVSILTALPQLIALVKQIIDAIHGHPAQALHEHAFLGIIRAWTDHKDPAQLEDDLKKLAARL